MPATSHAAARTMPAELESGRLELEAALAKVARVITGQDAMSVAFDARGPGVANDRITLPLTSGAEMPAIEVLIGYVDLLAARIKHSRLQELDALGTGVVKDLAQSVEDRRICQQLFDAYPGARWFVLKLREHAAQDTRKRWSALSWRDKFLWLAQRVLWDEMPSAIEREPPLVAALRASAPALAQARHGGSTHDSIRAAQAVIAAVRALAAGANNNMMFTAGPVDGLDAQTLATDFETPGSATEAAAPEAAAPAPPQGEPGEPGGEAAEAAGLGQSAPNAEGLSESVPGAPAGGQALAGTRPDLSIPLSTAFDVVTDLTGHGDLAAWRALRALARAETAPLKAKLERALRADELTHWNREQERGEIDRPALARLATSPAYRTPFRIRRITKGRDAAVTLLIDRSGSMAGQKIQLARLCAAALCDALVQLGFDCEVLGYSSIDSADLQRVYARALAAGTDLRGYNRFVERLDLQIYKRFGAADLTGLAAVECGHENPDGEALAWAAGRLAEHRAERRILMVLSDGYPATGDGDPAILRDDLRQRAAAVQKMGIELLGVGILDDAVQSFYPRHIVVRKLNDLPSEAFSALSKMLLNR